MRKFKHIPTGRILDTQFIGENRVEGIVWGAWKIPMWVVENTTDWEEVKKPKKVIFTTEDNVGVHEGDVYYIPQRDNKGNFTGEVSELTLNIIGDFPETVIRFSSRENAEAYISKYKNYTTTDGYAIRKGDIFYIYDDKSHKLFGEFGHFTGSKFDGKRYRTKEALENVRSANSDIKNAAEKQIEEYQTEISNLEYDLNTKNDEYNELQNKVGQLEDEVEELRDYIKELRATINDYSV